MNDDTDAVQFSDNINLLRNALNNDSIRTNAGKECSTFEVNQENDSAAGEPADGKLIV